jgi:catalase
VAHLLNVHTGLATGVAEGLGLLQLPRPSTPAQTPNTTLPPSPSLSILLNGPQSMQGRKIGVLVSFGADASLFQHVVKLSEKAGCVVEVIGPVVGGVKLSDGSVIPANHNFEGGPSVLFDAVVILWSPEAMALVRQRPSVKDFISDAFAHCKFIGYNKPAEALVAKLVDAIDEGCMLLEKDEDMKLFLQRGKALRYWTRELVASGLPPLEANPAHSPSEAPVPTPSE